MPPQTLQNNKIPGADPENFVVPSSPELKGGETRQRYASPEELAQLATKEATEALKSTPNVEFVGSNHRNQSDETVREITDNNATEQITVATELYAGAPEHVNTAYIIGHDIEWMRTEFGVDNIMYVPLEQNHFIDTAANPAQQSFVPRTSQTER